MKQTASYQESIEHRKRGGLPLSSGISAEAVRSELETILSSPGFARSERLSRFLRFAVEKTLQGEGDRLKEYLLGVEVFDKGESYDTRIDPIVRVEAARLRSKLKDYYLTDGRSDTVLIDFDKGSYIPVFQRGRPVQSPEIAAKASLNVLRHWRDLLLAISLLLGCIATFWAVSLYKSNTILQQQARAPQRTGLNPLFAPFWGRFFAPGAQNHVVFGSPMFFSSDRLGIFLRRTSLNDPTNVVSDPGFKLLAQRFGPLAGPYFYYAEMGDAIALQRLTAFFGQNGGKLTALPAHLTTWDSIKDGNIIFLGTPRMNSLLRKLPVKKDFEWGSDNNIYNRDPQSGEQKIYETTSNRDATTYFVLALFSGLQPTKEILLLMSHSSPGALAAVDYVTGPETIRTVKDKLQLADSGPPKHFQMLLRVAVDNNIPVKTEYVTHHLVEPAVQKH
ncbi:MAG TPA: hypothetical protein VGQ81_17325 [Acidobacteriota bacterium]|jgi:hypothetical protein|nr:hypothetical protein [Acidobacteriota bacterium]